MYINCTLLHYCNENAENVITNYESMGIPQIRTIIDHRTAERLFFSFPFSIVTAHISYYDIMYVDIMYSQSN